MREKQSVTVEEYKAMVGGQQAPWSRARKTWACPGCLAIIPLKGGNCPHCKLELIRFDSKKEATVFGQIMRERKSGEALLRQVRFPLLALAPDPKTGKPLYVTVDFVVVGGGQIRRIADAKGRLSRDWLRGKRALEATLNMRVEEI